MRTGCQRPWLARRGPWCVASRFIRRRPAAVEGGIAMWRAECRVALNGPVHDGPSPFCWALVSLPGVLVRLRPVVVEATPVGTLRLFLGQRGAGNQVAVHASHWGAGARAGCRLFLEFDGRHVNPESRFEGNRWGVGGRAGVRPAGRPPGPGCVASRGARYKVSHHSRFSALARTSGPVPVG